MSFSVYRPIRPPTSVDHSTTARFTVANEEELIIARVNFLEVWRAPKLPERPVAEWITSYELHGEINSLATLKVDLDSLTPTESLTWRHRLPENGLDCLVLTFDEGKISVVCFDPSNPRTLRTVAIFNFEESARATELKPRKAGTLPVNRGAFSARAKAFVDPQHRAIAMVLFSTYVAVIPLRKLPSSTDEQHREAKQLLVQLLEGTDEEPSSSDDDDNDGGDAGPKRQQRIRSKMTTKGAVLRRSSTLKRECGNDHPLFGRPHILPMLRFGIPQRGALDACFVAESARPTLIVLHTGPMRSWASRVVVARDTCGVTAISLVPEDPLSATRLWNVSDLSYDSQRVLPVPGESGCLVVATNSISYVSNNVTERYTMGVNGYAMVSNAASMSHPIYDMDGHPISLSADKSASVFDEDEDADRIDVALTLEACVFSFPSKNVLLITLASGVIFQVNIGRIVRGKSPTMIGRVVGSLPGVSSCTCASIIAGGPEQESDMLFFGSRSADGVFVRVRQTQSSNLAQIVGSGITSTSMMMEDVKLSSTSMNGEMSEMEVEHFLYESDQASVLYNPNVSTDFRTIELSLEAVDYLPVTGPITDMDFADSMPTVTAKEGADEEDERKLAAAKKQAEEFKAKRFFSEVAKILERVNAEVDEDRRKRAIEAVRRDVDLISCGSKNRFGGPLLAFQCGFRPLLRSEIPISECGQMFFVEPNLLVLSESNKTRVFKWTPSELAEMEASAMALDSRPTLFAGRLGLNDNAVVIVQVFADEICCLDDSAEVVLHRVPLNSEGSDGDNLIVSVCAEKDTLVLLMSNGSVRLYRLDSKSPKLNQVNCGEAIDSKEFGCVTCFVNPLTGVFCLAAIRAGTSMEAESGVLEIFERVKGETEKTETFKLAFKSHMAFPLCPPILKNAVAQDVSMLDAQNKTEDEKEMSTKVGVLTNSKVVDLIIAKASDGVSFRLVLAAALADGELVVYSKARDSDSVWSKVEHKTVLRGLRGRVTRKRKYAAPSGPNTKAFRGPLLVRARGIEGMMDGIFYLGQRPCFVVQSRGQVSVVPLASSVAAPIPPPVAPLAEEMANFLAGSGIVDGSTQNNQASQNGSTGVKPTKRRQTNLIPDVADANRIRGPIHAFCSLPDGNFVYALRMLESKVPVPKPTLVRFCASPVTLVTPGTSDVRGGIPARHWQVARSGWAVTKVVFLPQASRGSEEEIPLSVHASTLAIVTSRQESLRRKQVDDDEKEEEMDVPELEPDPKLGGAPDILVTRQSIDIIRAPEYSKILVSFLLKADERVLSMITADLDAPIPQEEQQSSKQQQQQQQQQNAQQTGNPSTKPPRKRLTGLLIIGTGIVSDKGEDSSSEGRIIVLAIDHVADRTMSPEEVQRAIKTLGRPATRPSLRVVADVALRGPVSALATIDGKILAATGNLPCQLKLLELSGRNEGLIPVGFYDAPTCVVSMNVVRDQYVLLGDMNQSLQFIRWKDRQFQLLGKSFESIRVFSTELALDGNKLMLCVGDDEANIRVWHLDAEAQLLRPRAEMNIGTRVGKMRTKRVNPLPPRIDEGYGPGGIDALTGLPFAATVLNPTANPMLAESKWSVTLGTLAGGLSVVQPVNESTFRRLDLLQHAMMSNSHVLRNAGLHPFQCAQPKVAKRPATRFRDTRFIVDGRIVSRFVDLDKINQRKLALMVGSTVDTIMDTLLELDLMAVW